MRKPSGGERAWFLEEESEPRNKVSSLAGGNHRADVSAYQTDHTWIIQDKFCADILYELFRLIINTALEGLRIPIEMRRPLI
jgi:hypothetical protein